MRTHTDIPKSYPVTARYAGRGRWKIQDMRSRRNLYEHEFTLANAFDLASRINAGLHSHSIDILVTAFATVAEDLKEA